MSDHKEETMSGTEHQKRHEGLYVADDIGDGFLIKRRPHTLELEGAPDWMVELAYEYSGGRRHPVRVAIRPYCLIIGDHELNLLNYYKLNEVVARELMKNWRGGLESCEHGGECECRPKEELHLHRMREWAVKRTAWSVNRLVHGQWKRLIASVDETVVQVQKKVFAASFGYGDVKLVRNPQFYDNRFVVKDVLAYRAAAVAALICDRSHLPTIDAKIEAMSDWMAVFSPTGKSYPALNRTLMNLPGGIPPKALIGLCHCVLPRTILSRLELLATILAHRQEEPRNIRVWCFARENQIAEAVRRVGTATQRNLSTRRWRDVEDTVAYVNDYPDLHNGGLLGLTEKAIRWHRDCRREAAEREIAIYGPEKLLAKPPIPLPSLPGVRFLQSVGDLCQEGEDMEHCIATYTGKALNGVAYLFHVDHEGERASVQIDWHGNVLQARGPRNSDNLAAEWGRKVLQKWGVGLRLRSIASER